MIIGKKPIPKIVTLYIVIIMKLVQTEKCTCEPYEYDTFQFMAKRLNMKVLHPGGLKATKLLVKQSKISKNMIVLDAGCGSGSSSIFLAQKYGCKVVGIDLDQQSLIKAHKTARRKSLLDRVSFRSMDIVDLHFENEIFDGVICQAALIFTNKSKALNAISSKLRPEGFLGIIELAWKTTPSTTIDRKVGKTLCAAAVNTEEHFEWIKLLRKTGFNVVYAKLHDLNFNFSGMLNNEGFIATLRIALKCALNKEAKEKTRSVTKLFKETQKYLGYGIYVARKKE
jgi:2-polyprenyl-3-methyl-5-hydroxy-6-metoxy-1,4-benzoquinol methylase